MVSQLEGSSAMISSGFPRSQMGHATPACFTTCLKKTARMHTRSPQSLSWTDILGALRQCAGKSVLLRDGRITQPAAAVRNRPSAKGSELCLFSGETPAARLELIEQLAALAKSAGRRFMTSARAHINGSNLIVEGVADENIDGVVYAVVKTRRPKLGFNQSQQIGATTTLRSKRIKNV